MSIWLFTLVTFVHTAFAASTLNYYGSCLVSAAGNTDSCVNQRGTVTDPTVLGNDSASASFSADGYVANASATYDFSVDYGRLRSSITAFSSVAVPDFNSSYVGASPFATVSSQASFYDEITPYSTTLAVGTPVLINYQIPIHGLINATTKTGSNVYLTYNVGWGFGDGTSGAYFGDAYTTTSFTNLVKSGSFMARIGQARYVTESIDLLADAYGKAFFANGSYHTSFADLTLNFNNTVELFLGVDDPNISLLATSGHNYAAPVPEPSTLAILFLGISGLFWYRRRFG